MDHADYVLSADTGVIHVAELLGKKGGLLSGPTAFGRTKLSSIKVFEANLKCMPCSKDGQENAQDVSIRSAWLNFFPKE